MTKKEVRILIKNSKKTFYVYGLLKPDSTPFYIGKGKQYRLFNHEKEIYKDYYNPLKSEIIKYIINNDDELYYEIYKFFDNDNEEESFLLEKELIKKYGRIDLGTGILTNLTDGGDGEAPSPYTIEKIKNLWKNEEYRNKQVESHINYYKIPGMKEKNSECIKRSHEENPEIRIQQAKSREKYFKDSEFRKKIGKSRKRFNIDNPDKYKMNQQKSIEASRTPEARKKNSDAKKEWFVNNPEKSAERTKKIKETCNTEEYKIRQSIAQKKRFENPEQIKKCSKSQKDRFSDPSQREHQRQKSLEITKKRKSLIDECLSLIKTYQIPIKNFPSKKSSLKTFEKVKDILISYIKERELI